MKERKSVKVKTNILFTGGWTAGYVIVNLALIPVFQDEGWQVAYIGSKEGIERRLIEQMPNVDYYPVSTGKLRRYMSIENFKDPFKVLKGTMQARSEEHTSELQSRFDLVCRLLLEKKE